MCSCPWPCPVVCFVEAESGSWAAGKGKTALLCWFCLKACGNGARQFQVHPRQGSAEQSWVVAVLLNLIPAAPDTPCCPRHSLLPRWSGLTWVKTGPSEHLGRPTCCSLSQRIEWLVLAQRGAGIHPGDGKCAHSLLPPAGLSSPTPGFASDIPGWRGQMGAPVSIR